MMLQSVCDDFRAHRRNWRPQGLREMPAINRLGFESAQNDSSIEITT
jgi:hypothetical protein